jgi:hypothetical protein
MNELTAARAPVDAEAVPLAGEMARAVGKMVADLEQHWNLTRDQALDRIHEHDPRAIERIRTAPPNQVTFVDLYTLGRHLPELAARRWAEVMQAARNELTSGHRAASIVVPRSASSCWHKARLLAMRAELLDGWQPRNSVERLLVDTLMQVQSQYEHWLGVLTARTTLEALYESKEEPRWEPPHVTASEAIEQAAAMVDRFHRIMMRTVRQLQKLRRNPPVVMVNSAGQVNVGQQVNAFAGG